MNAVASEIGIDQSGVAPLEKNAADAGYAVMATWQTDGRKGEVTATPSGDAGLQEAHARQEQVFDELTVGWSRLRREEFHAGMPALLRHSYLTNVEPQDIGHAGAGGSADPKSGMAVSAGDDRLDAAEAAEWPGCSVWTIRRWVSEGKLSAWKGAASASDGRRAMGRFVRRSELDEKFRPDRHAEHVNQIREGG